MEPYADVDANGIAEVIVPAIAANRRFPNGGAVYLLSTTSVGDVDEGALAVIEAGGTDWYLGVAVDARDIDGDALPEVLLTAPGKDTTGAGYLVLGAALTAGDITLPDDAAFAFDGSEAATYWGSDIAFLGDVDGDGVDEVAMSASFAAVEGAEAAGRVAVFSLTSPVNATADPDYRWDGYYADGRFGETVASVGDVDGDGLTDTLVSAEQGDIFVVLPGVSGSIVDIALSRVTRDGDDSRYRSVPVGNLDGLDGDDVLLLGTDLAYLFTGLGTFAVRSQADAWMTIHASAGSQFGDATNLGDRTGDGLPETLLTRTWSPSDATAWAGVLASEDLEWRGEVNTDTLPLSALSSRPGAGHGARAALLDGPTDVIVFGGATDDRGAAGGGSVAILTAPD